MPLARSPTRVSDHTASGSDHPIAGPSRMEKTESIATTAAGEVNAVARVKLPSFWKENPLLWFSQVDAAFVLSKIVSDDIKFRNVVLNLDPTVLPFVADIITNPPEHGKYDCLKQRILGALDESSESKLRRLLRGHGMGDEKPSNYLQRLRNLAGGQCSDSVLRTLFLEQMPENIRVILAISEGMDLGKLALQADKIYEIASPGVATISDVRPPSVVDARPLSVAAVSSTSRSSSDLNDQLSEILARLRRLEARDTGDGNGNRRRNGKSSKPQGSRTRSRSRDGLCRLHYKYGADARHCFPPCRWINRGSREN
ncbi:uncharacterized protein LOC123988647 [Osmia bicornis bicornis]|uniref:uncharacterized protein LOC123988647 n=1 Tax=Osmia bicornis bicornis TaxID=1437191 RepID=UPI001EAF368D|nr:uncharacterized protein LOC123988647 [Osmia bicornis bicornis]